MQCKYASKVFYLDKYIIMLGFFIIPYYGLCQYSLPSWRQDYVVLKCYGLSNKPNNVMILKYSVLKWNQY